MDWTTERAAAFIDHTLLKPQATQAQIDQLCEEALSLGFAAVCVNPVHVPFCVKKLSGASPKVCTVVGFPLGASPTELKVAEARWALHEGADEIDMVMSIGAAKDGSWDEVGADIAAVVEEGGGKTVKVILETCYLNSEEKTLACQAAERAGARFVKTSTGFGAGGATVEDVVLMREAVSKNVEIKASGGIRDWQTMQAMIRAGAGRIGVSAGVAILNELR